MLSKKMVMVLATAVLLLASFSGEARAEKKGFELRSADTIGSVLERHVGKVVELFLASGEKVRGVVVKVGPHTVHIGKLAGMDFYDAVVRIDGIDSVVFQVRGK